MDKEKQQTLDCWAIVELMGHQRIAGRVTERSVAGVMMIQVDVPAVEEWPAFTRMLGGGAIYAINPCDEETARSWARTSMTTASPITSFEGRGLLTKMAEKIVERQNAGALPAASADRQDLDDHEDLRDADGYDDDDDANDDDQ